MLHEFLPEEEEREQVVRAGGEGESSIFGALHDQNICLEGDGDLSLRWSTVFAWHCLLSPQLGNGFPSPTPKALPGIWNAE